MTAYCPKRRTAACERFRTGSGDWVCLWCGDRLSGDKLREAGDTAADDGIDRAREHAREGWNDRAYAAVVAVARIQLLFTTDDVWGLLGDDKPREPRAMGGVMRKAVRDRICEPTDLWRRSERPEAHRRPVRVYRSLIEGST